MNYLIALLQSSIYMVVVLLYWYIAKVVVDKMTIYNDDYEIEVKKNQAMGYMRCGLYLGIAIGMAGALSGNGNDHMFTKDVGLLILDGVFVVPLLIFSRFINDKLILSKVNNDDEIGRGNIAVGVAELGSLIGAGLVLNGSFCGEGSVWSGLAFFALGQTVFMGGIMLFESFRNHDLRGEIRMGNIAAGILLASKFISLGFILRTSIIGPFVGWTEDLFSFAVSAVAGIVLIMIFNCIADRFFLPNTTAEHQLTEAQNVSAAIIMAGIEVGLALIVSTII